MGIEPTSSAWKAEVIAIIRYPLALNRATSNHSELTALNFNANWWRGQDSNLRRLSRQIYSLIPLTAREPLQTNFELVPAPRVELGTY